MSEYPIDLPDAAHKLCKLPLVGPVSARIRQELDSASEFGTLLQHLSLDPAIAAEILVAANSPAYGFASRIHTVEEAVRILGSEHARLLVHAIVNTAPPADGRMASMVQAGWIHSLASAFFASEMALFFGVEEDRAYTIGLMHDIGRLGLLSAFPDPYLQVMAHRYPTLPEFLAAEERAVGMNHAKAGQSLARTWGLPEDFSEAAGEHHNTSADENGPVANLAKLACRLAHASGFLAEPCDQITPSESLAGSETPLDQVLQEVQASGLAKLWERIDPFCSASSLTAPFGQGSVRR
jgi:putative nucleotidyltransferase with HDIG domain